MRPTILACLLVGCGGGVEKVAGVAYDERYGSTVLDVYLPDDGAAGRPAVMTIHGGELREGSRDSPYADHARRLAASGYVAIAIDYRLSHEAIYPAAIQDTFCALSFVRSNAGAWGLDPDRIAVSGYSAGGYLGSMLGVAFEVPEVQPDCAAGPTGRPAAVISGAGPQDFRGALSDHEATLAFLGGTQEEYPERYAAASPITHVRPDASPFLFIHGTADASVPVEQSRAMRDALRAQGADAHLLELVGVGHLVGYGGDGGHAEIGVLSIDPPEAWIATIDFLADTIGEP